MQHPAVPQALALALLLAAAPAGAQTPAGPAPFLEQVEVEVVNVDIHVTDGAGKPVTGLGKGDFELLEDGKPVKLANFAAVSGESSAPRDSRKAPDPEGATPPPAPLPPSQIAEEQRFHLVIYIDNGNLRPAHRARVLLALEKLLDGQLNPADRIMLVSYDQGVHVRLPFTSDRAAVRAALEQVARQAPGNDLDAQRRIAYRTFEEIQAIEPCDQRVVQPIEGYAETTRQEVLRSLRGLTLLVNSLAGVPGRKAILHVSDGIPLTPGQDLYEVLYQLCGGVSDVAQSEGVASRTSSSTKYDGRHAALDAQHYSTADDFRKLTDHANAQGVPFYTLQASGLVGPASASAEYDLGERGLQLPAVDSAFKSNLQDSLTTMASETGGRAILNANDPGPDFAQMRTDFESYYSLGFSPAHHGDGREHRLEVRVKRPGLRLRYRKAYRDEPALERAVNRTLATLLHGFEDNPIEITMTAEEGTPAAASGVWQVPVRLRIPLWKLALLTREEGYEGRLRLLVLTRDAGEKLSPVRQVDVPIHIPKLQALNALGQYYAYDLALQLPSGPYRLAVAVHDEYGGTTSYLGRDLAVGKNTAR